MELKLYQVDAFAGKLFEGNPAAVCPLESWLPDEMMQAIAGENNLSETAFFWDIFNSFLFPGQFLDRESAFRDDTLFGFMESLVYSSYHTPGSIGDKMRRVERYGAEDIIHY